jgi:hypothetical protein
MQISRDADGLRFLGECAPESGFIAGGIRCTACGRRIDPHVDSRDISLVCTGCGFKKAFWAEAAMQVFLAENWEPSETGVRSSLGYDASTAPKLIQPAAFWTLQSLRPPLDSLD